MTEQIRDFAVPDLGEGLEDATVVAWHVDVGGPVELNDPLCTLETAKAEVEVPSPFAGTLVEQGGSPGDTLVVGSLLARISVDGSTRDGSTRDSADRTSPEEGRDNAQQSVGHHPVLVGYGVDDDPTADGAAHEGVIERSPGPRVLAKPPVRKLARTLGVDLAAVSPGSGPDGIVTRSDVEAAARTRPANGGGDREPEDREPELVRLEGVRLRVAERMAASRSAIPDATCSVEVDCSKLLALRDLWRPEVPAVTPFAIACRILVGVLPRHPRLNATYVDEGPAIRVHPAVHLGVATATDRGLVVPVVRDAGGLTGAAMITRIADVVERARAGTLPPADLVGSTFTISNFGSLGIDEGIPVINPPEAAVLGMGAIKDRAVVIDGQVVARPMVRLTLAFDHRVSDGADAGSFLGDLRRVLESPELALLHA